jgi:aspartate ammonia-lyase
VPFRAGADPVPADAYYGVQTVRALENFHISGVLLHLYLDLIRALGMVKMAAARANFDCSQFSPHDCVNGSQSTNDAYPTALHYSHIKAERLRACDIYTKQCSVNVNPKDLAVSPGKFGIAAIAPPLDKAGNSVKAQKAIADVSNALRRNPCAPKPR